jgi:hypothetical protein
MWSTIEVPTTQGKKTTAFLGPVSPFFMYVERLHCHIQYLASRIFLFQAQVCLLGIIEFLQSSLASLA